MRRESVCAEHEMAEVCVHVYMRERVSMCVCLTGRGQQHGVTVRVNPRQQLSFMTLMN